MFGYVLPSKLDMTFRDFFSYKAYYCGICKSLKKNYGQLSRFSLNYDITFLAVLLSAIYKENENILYQECISNPFRKRRVIINEFTNYCASINILLTYHKLLDNYFDDKSVLALLVSKLFEHKFIMSSKLYPKKEEELTTRLKIFNQLEDKNAEIDELANEFGNILGELFIFDKSDQNSSLLRQIGFYIGKYIYYLDCYDDLSKDIRKSRFNPLKSKEIKDKNEYVHNAVDEIIAMLNNLVGQLELKQSREIISNIIRFGLRGKAEKILKKEEIK